MGTSLTRRPTSVLLCASLIVIVLLIVLRCQSSKSLHFQISSWYSRAISISHKPFWVVTVPKERILYRVQVRRFEMYGDWKPRKYRDKKTGLSGVRLHVGSQGVGTLNTECRRSRRGGTVDEKSTEVWSPSHNYT